jgi:hypothetical protein
LKWRSSGEENEKMEEGQILVENEIQEMGRIEMEKF